MRAASEMAVNDSSFSVIMGGSGCVGVEVEGA